MDANASSNASLPSPRHCFSNSSGYPHIFTCLNSTVSSIIFTIYTFTNLLVLLPIYSLVLFAAVRRWRRRSSAGTTSHSDVFTYHMVIMELFSVWGATFYYYGILECSPTMMAFGYFSFGFSYPGQSFFHLLTCVERYLAVVCPVTYRGLRQAGGVRIRNISIGCVWLLCTGLTGLTAFYFPDFPTTEFFVFFAITTGAVWFCSLSALRALIGLHLGKVGGNGEQIDQVKQRALLMLMAIMGTLGLRFCGLVLCNAVFDLGGRSGAHGCVMLICGMWLCMPSSLVLPLLFLHRAGTLECSSRTVTQGEN